MAKEIDEQCNNNGLENIKKVNFEGEIWAIKDKEPSQELLSFLTSKDCLLVLRSGEPAYKVIFAVPHQASIGEEYILRREEGNLMRMRLHTP
jgi:hypothetical protein